MNRKGWIIFIVCMLMLLSLAACGKTGGAGDSVQPEPESTAQQAEAENSEAEENLENTADEEPEPAAVEKIELTCTYSGFDESAVITAYDAAGNTVWSHETQEYGTTELEAIVEFGQKDGCYYYVEDTTVVCLDVQTGTCLWENHDFAGRGASFAFGDSALYLCGYYGPDFFVVSYTGETLTRIEHFDPNYFWASGIELQGEQAIVNLYGGIERNDDPILFYVDLDTYEVDHVEYPFVAEALATDADMRPYVINDTLKKIPPTQSCMEQYRLVLLMYPAETSGITTKYTLHDIDKDGTPELIVREGISHYYIYSFDGEQVIPSEMFYWNYSNGLYAYDGNGLVVHDGGQGFMRFEYVEFYTMTGRQLEWSEELMSSENYTYNEIREYLDTLTPIDNFIPITDASYLSNS